MTISYLLRELNTCKTLRTKVLGEKREKRTCNTWSKWSSYSKCSRSCATGTRTKTRKCQFKKGSQTKTVSSYLCQGGYNASIEKPDCNTHKCPEWGSWSSSCCGSGGCHRCYKRTCYDFIYGYKRATSASKCEGGYNASNKKSHWDCGGWLCTKFKISG